MILGFRDHSTSDLYHGNDTKAARRIPKSIWNIAARKLDMLNAAADLLDLRIPPGNRLEALKGNYSSFHSIRINDQYRIIFKWSAGNAVDVQIVDYH